MEFLWFGRQLRNFRNALWQLIRNALHPHLEVGAAEEIPRGGQEERAGHGSGVHLTNRPTTGVIWLD